MHLPHRWEDCSGEWRPDFCDQSKRSWSSHTLFHGIPPRMWLNPICSA